ncbi:MAG: flavodoxin domain-containing protein [Bacteroidota bacterium]
MSLSIFYGSVFGNAQNVAEKLQEHLSANGIESNVVTKPQVQDFKNATAIFVVTSSCGQGEVPPNLEEVIDEIGEQKPDLKDKSFAVATLGDSSYVDTFCGAGKKVFKVLEDCNGKAIAPLLEVDAIETFEADVDVIEWVDGIIGDLAQ